MTACEGVLPVVATTFDADGEVAHGAIEAVVRSRATRGVEGVICVGIAAASYERSDPERRTNVEPGGAREQAAHPDAHDDAQFEAALERVLAVVD